MATHQDSQTEMQEPGTQLQPVYLDNAATSFPKPPEVVAAIRECLDQSLTVARSTHRAAFRADEVLRRCRVKLARFLNAAAPEEIIYTFSSTDALNLAIHGMLPPGAHVIVSPLEHHSVMRPLHHLRRAGQADFSVLPASAAGYVDPDSIHALLRPETRLIIVNMISNVSGVEQPVAAIGAVAGELGIPYLVDASQAAGSHPIDVEAIGCTALAFPGHKSMMSIPGTGVLYLRRGHEIEPWRIGGTGVRSELLFQPEERPQRYEAGTPNVAGIVGLDAAQDWFENIGTTAIFGQIQDNAMALLTGLLEIPNIRVIGPAASEPRGSVISFTVPGIDPLVFSEALASAYGISSRPGLHCAPSAHRHYGTLESGGTVRLSGGYYTSEADIAAALAAVSRLSVELG